MGIGVAARPKSVLITTNGWAATRKAMKWMTEKKRQQRSYREALDGPVSGSDSEADIQVVHASATVSEGMNSSGAQHRPLVVKGV